MGGKTLNLQLILSLLLNVFFVYYIFFIGGRQSSGWSRQSSGWSRQSSGWSRQAAEEAEAVAAIVCSGHGRAYVDSVVVGGGPTCECNTCYDGADCSVLVSDCPANTESGDPLFLEPFWQLNAASSAVLMSGWHRMSYQANGDNFISLELERHIRLLHKAVGNAVAGGSSIVFGTGSAQLINAAVHALSPEAVNNDSSSSSPSLVVATPPYYGLYKTQTMFFDSREYQWKGATADWGNLSEFSSEKFIEFVTSPNNPDGLLKKSVLGGSSVVYDHAYYWPHYTAIPAPADEEVMLFTVSKVSGHASSRFGWALVKDKEVYQNMIQYLSVNTMGVSRDTQLRILKLFKVMLAEVGSKGDIFKFGSETLTKRWKKLENLISSSSRFSLQKISPQYCTYFQKIRDPSPAYAWVKCEREEDKDCQAVLREAGVISRAGNAFEAESRYTRLSLIKTQDDFDQLLAKLEALVSKEGFSSL